MGLGSWLLLISGLILIIRWTVAKNLDRYVRKKVLATSNDFVEEMMNHISRLGDRDLAMGIMVLILNDQVRLGSFAAVALGMTVAQVLNIVVGQTRPPQPVEYRLFTNDNQDHSFVSGHATGSFAFATIITSHYPQYGGLAYGGAALVALSRMYKDKHWFSNLIMGAMIGYASGIFIQQYGTDLVNYFF